MGNKKYEGLCTLYDQKLIKTIYCNLKSIKKKISILTTFIFSYFHFRAGVDEKRQIEGGEVLIQEQSLRIPVYMVIKRVCINNQILTLYYTMSGKPASPKNQLSLPQKVISLPKMKSTLSSNSQKAKKMEISKAQLKTHLIRKFRRGNPEKSSKQTRFAKVLQNTTQSISDERNFTCPICLQILISPIIFQCGHFGCLKCIETVSVYQNKCFLCRKVFENLQYKPSTVISTIINKSIVKNIDNPIQYYTRLADHLQWPKKKQLTIGELEIGSFVDVRCSESGKWKNGIVISVKNTKNLNYNLLVKYKHQGEFVEELIDISSSRLAKHGFYTEKRAIQASNDQTEEAQLDIPQISIDNFQNIPMDRNTFFVTRKEENYFSDSFGSGEEFFFEQKVVTPDPFNSQEAFDYFERDLQEFLNPHIEQSFLQSELLEAFY